MVKIIIWFLNRTRLGSSTAMQFIRVDDSAGRFPVWDKAAVEPTINRSAADATLVLISKLLAARLQLN